MSDDRAAKRRARRASGVRATHEMSTVFLTKACAEDLRAEMTALGLTGDLTQAEFMGRVLETAANQMRIAREAKAASTNLVQPATTTEVQKVLGAYQGARTPR